jgi:hypothetical protein
VLVLAEVENSAQTRLDGDDAQRLGLSRRRARRRLPAQGEEQWLNGLRRWSGMPSSGSTILTCGDAASGSKQRHLAWHGWSGGPAARGTAVAARCSGGAG